MAQFCVFMGCVCVYVSLAFFFLREETEKVWSRMGGKDLGTDKAGETGIRICYRKMIFN